MSSFLQNNDDNDHWSSKLNPLNMLRSQSPTKQKVAQDASTSRRQLELLDEDEYRTSLSLLRHSIPNGGPSTSRTLTTPAARTTGPSTPISRKDRAGSVRSILREPNTPGTGQSVRFFSRDAFKVISPLPSATASPTGSPFMNQVWRLPDPEELHDDVLQDLHEAGPTEDPKDQDKSASLILGREDGASNLFDMSLDMPPILVPVDASNMLSDDAVEVTSSDIVASNSVASASHPNASVNDFHSFRDASNDALRPTAGEDHQPSFFEKSSFYPAAPGRWIATPRKPQSSSLKTEKTSVSTGSTQFQTATSIQNPSTGSAQPSHVVKSNINALSTHIALIAALREELELQKKVNEQVQVDLTNRDEMVEILSQRVENAETECDLWRVEEDARSKEMRLLKKQLNGLEKMCVKLQEVGFHAVAGGSISLDKSISIADEASNQALKTLKERIKSLEEEKEELVMDVANAQDELNILKERIKNGEDDNSDIVGLVDERNELREKVAQLDEADALQRGEIDELKRLLKENEQRTQVDAPSKSQTEQMRFLQEELEAQWERTEKAEEELKHLRKENHELKGTVERLKESESSGDINQDLANQLNEVLSTQQALEEERDQIQEELQTSIRQVEDLMHSQSELQRKLEEAQEEVVLSSETIEHLERRLSTREQEIATLTSEHQAQFAEMESLRGRMTNSENLHMRKITDYSRQIEELQSQLDFTAESGREMVRGKAEGDVYIKALEEKANGRLEEIERLKRRVHALEMESAKREVTLLEVKKERDGFRDDNMNMNIALDSKQQEMELIKRKLGVKGTAGATPAPNKAYTRPRESSIFGATPRPLMGFGKTMIDTPATVKQSARADSALSSSITSVPSSTRTGDSAYGPRPITRPRESVGSPTPAIFARSTLAPSATIGTTTTIQFGDEKENLAPFKTSRRPNLMVAS